MESLEDAGGTSTAAGLVVFQHAEKELYQRLVEAARNRLAELELEYGSEKSKVDSMDGDEDFYPGANGGGQTEGLKAQL